MSSGNRFGDSTVMACQLRAEVDGIENATSLESPIITTVWAAPLPLETFHRDLRGARPAVPVLGIRDSCSSEHERDFRETVEHIEAPSKPGSARKFITIFQGCGLRIVICPSMLRPSCSIWNTKSCIQRRAPQPLSWRDQSKIHSARRSRSRGCEFRG